MRATGYSVYLFTFYFMFRGAFCPINRHACPYYP